MKTDESCKSVNSGEFTECSNVFIEQICLKILSFSGISVAKSQIPVLSAFIEKKAAQSGSTLRVYCENLKPDSPDFDEIINLVTVNETYFFREEKQFDFLKNEVFPKFAGKSLTLWTCCCSTGEEPVSILALALSMNVDITLYASDIDDNALDVLRKGCYSTFSLRTDGKKYHELLKPYSKINGNQIVFNRDFLNRINIFKFNLVQDTNFPFFENLDIVFMRNVFIYFDKETRILVTKKIADRLKNGGYLFFSMNEVVSIDNTIIPSCLYKINCGQVYFFTKGLNDEARKEYAAKKQTAQKIREEEYKKRILRQEKMRRETEKARFDRKNERVEQAKLSGSTKPSNSLPQSVASPSSEFDIKRTYEDICNEINVGNFTKALTIARAISGSNYKKYSFFLQGYIEYHADNRAAAETFFASAETLSPDFWPAFFYHGMVLRDLDKSEQAFVCFAKCKELLEDSKNKTMYDFTLDSFSPSYIYSLCETFSKKTRRQ